MKGGPDGDNQDALWNFHAWTEVWMSRPDLQAGFNGWQAIDPTPPPQFWQNNSGVMYIRVFFRSSDQKNRGPWAVEAFRRGPSSVESVRRGEVGFAYDTPYLFAEVNAEVSHFQEDETSHWGFRKIHVNNYHVGRMILTKRPGADDDVSDADAEDITSLYKNPDGMSRYQKQGDGCFNSHFNQGMSSPYLERRDRDRDMMHYPGTSVRRLSIVDIARKPWYDESRHAVDPGSAAERMSSMNAARSVERSQPMFDNRPINDDNRSQEMRTITTILSANSVYYTGVTARRLGRSDRQFVLQPGGRTLLRSLRYTHVNLLVQRETLQIRISWDEYRDKIVDYGHIKIYAMASVQETKQCWSEEDDFQLEKPKLDVQIRGNPRLDRIASSPSVL
uniref:Uncharacterized protein n=1 Tax=Daphnia galeata TaxID=27404 RepID=A0A8J2RTH2_9CRUS|nr:unnamed protein product [Daphnia galeata]